MSKKLEVVFVVPSRYDDDGYAVRWRKGVVPSNSLAVLKSLTQRLVDTRQIESMIAYDDNIEAVPFEKIAKRNQQPDTRVIVGIVGVQSNQFCRASDIAMKFRQLGVDVLIGGFHVTGVLALFDTPTPELQTLLDAGVSLIVGEAETAGVLEDLFNDAINGKLQSVYRFPKGPDLTDAPVPQADPRYIDHFGARWATIDSSRGCPFGCTFCTVINIQGRKMRCRSSERVLETVSNNCKKGVSHFFFTDDNFARSAHWEAIFDGLAELRSQGRDVGFMMQIDTQAAKIPNFVEKAKAAGCRMVFVGMESVNPDNIDSAGKTQNKVDQYRGMVQCWQGAGVVVHVGYIIGFLNDTLESVRRDVVFLRDHVGVDLASFFMMTPLPGSVNHKVMLENGEWIDPDLNKYDSFHETFKHPKMPEGDWKKACQLAYNEFYTKENCINILRRIPKEHYWLMFWNLIWYRYSGVFSGTHPMMTGFFRVKKRLDRRPGFPRESILQFGWRGIKEACLDASSYFKLFFEFQEIWFLTRPKLSAKVAADSSAVSAQNTGVAAAPVSTRTLKPARHIADFLAPLAQLKQHWESLKQRVAEYSWQGQYEAAVSELANALKATKAKLLAAIHSVSAASAHKNIKGIRDIETIRAEIDTCLNELEQREATPELVFDSERSIHDKIIAPYEALVTRYMRMRRELNLWRCNAINRLKQGKVVHSSAGLIRRPWLAMVEAYLSTRFFIAAMRKEL